MSLFSDETLFYIFYSMPGDALQIAAAHELYPSPHFSDLHRLHSERRSLPSSWRARFFLIALWMQNETVS